MVREFFNNWLFKEAAPQPDERVIRIVKTQEIGSTGSENYSGYPREEYLDALQGSPRAELYDKMRRNDPQIKMVLSAVTSPIKRATWEFEPCDMAEGWAQEDADLCKYLFFELMDKTWKQYLGEALGFLPFGHSVFEMVDVLHMNDPKFKQIHALSLRWRSPKTIERWNLDPLTGKLASITQYAYGDLQRTVDIPAQFLQVLTLDQEGSNYEGISALRPCYGSWYRKQEYLKLNAIGIEKHAIPTVVASVPDGKANTAEFAMLKEVLESWVAHEKQFITKPVGWDVELHSNAYDPQKVEGSITAEDVRIVKSFMANFLELGMSGGGGSYALSFDLSDFFLSSIEHVADIVADHFNRVIIPRTIQINRGPRPSYPKLKVSGISDKLGEEFARFMDIMVGKKIITPDNVLEAHIRKRMRLPEMSEDGKRDISPILPGQNYPTKPEREDDEEQESGKQDAKPKEKPDAKGNAPKEKGDDEEEVVPQLAKKIRSLRLDMR